MSLSIAISTALSALRVSQTGLQVTSNNIANANSPGYSRKVVNREHVVVAGLGQGVDIGSITRQVDRFLLNDLRIQASGLGQASVGNNYFSLMQEMFGPPGSDANVSATINSLSTAIDALSISPESAGLRLDTIQASIKLVNQLNNLSSSLQQLRLQADQEIATAVNTVNTQLSIIEEMNGKISTNLSLGRPVGDLEDERDRALATLSENIDITSYTRETGEVIVLLGNGRPLSNGGAATLSYAGAVGMDPALHYVAPGDPDYVALNATNYPSGGIAGILLDSAGEILDATPLISSGRIRGLLDLRDQSLPNLNEEIDALAREIRDALNVVHNGGSGLPAPATLTGSHTWASGIASSTGTIRIAAVDGTGTLQGDALHLDLSGLTWPATLADIANAINTAAGTATPVTASVVNNRLVLTADTTGHGVAINQGNSAMAGTGRGFSEYMGLNDLFTTSTDIHIMTGTVARAVVAPGAPADPTGTTTITVQDDDGATVGTLSLDLADAAFTYPATLASFAAAITSIANGQGLPITAAASGTSLVLQANDSTHAITLGSESVTIDGASTTLAAYFGLTPTLRGSEAANIALRSDIETNPAFFSRGLLDTATARSTGPALAGSVVPGAIAAPTAGTLELTVTNADGTVQGNTLSLDLVNDITYPATLASYVNDINTAAGIQGVAITATVSGTGTLVLTSNDSTLHVAVEELGVDMDGAGQSFVAAFGLPQNSAGVSAGDARNVISLSQAFTGNQTFAGAGGLAPMQTTLAGYGSAIVALNAANAANAIDDHAFRDLLFDNTEYKASSVSGVNVDQELAEMMMLQNAYSAAARVLNTASDMLRMLAELAA